MRVALIGASGLIGSHLLGHLGGRDLLALSRSPTLPAGSNWREKIGDKEEWPGLLAGEAIDVAVAAIGTTRAKTADWAAYEAIDRHAIVRFAEAARGAGARQLIVVSSAMADPDSRSPYLAIKGRMERDVAALGFERVDIVRPGLLRGDRGAEERPAEKIGALLSPLTNLLLRGRLDRFQAIDAAEVATAIARLVGKAGAGVHFHHNREIRALSVGLAS